jgi:H/ACA ribonucleoprotein complex subunit 4
MPLPFEKRYLQILPRTGCATIPVPLDMPEKIEADELLAGSFIVIDKPPDCTSHDVVDEVRRILGIRRAGHTGTLDPMVTGVLPVAIEKATRLTGVTLSAGKVYEAEMLLHADVPENAVRETLLGMVGVITQLPPVKSRVKRVEREREIYEIEIHSIEKRVVRFRVSCEGGTYIRKLIHDAGEIIGCGAHMSALRRTQAGPFKLADAVKIPDFENAVNQYKSGDGAALFGMLKCMESAVAHMPKVWASEDAREFLKNGADLYAPGVEFVNHPVFAGETVAVFTVSGKLLALGELAASSGEILEMQRGTAVKTRKIFI